MKPLELVCRSVVLALTLTTRLALGAAGDLDPNFGTGGKVTIGAGTSNTISSVTVDGEGRILAAGVVNNNTEGDMAVFRFLPDGTPDPSFNGTGEVIIDFDGARSSARDVVVQNDGKIVVVGSSGPGVDSLAAIARLRVDGTLDPAFNGTGKVTVSIGLSFSAANAVALQPDGKIVIAGQSTLNDISNDRKVAVARLRVDGTLDGTFSGDGRAVFELTTGSAATFERGVVDVGQGEAQELAIQNDGKIVLAVQYVRSGFDFGLVRLKANGALDTSFNRTGIVIKDLGTNRDFIHSLALRPDGKIVVGGLRGTAVAVDDFVLMRYLPSGAPDTSFGTGGLVTTDFQGRGDGAIEIRLLPDGRIVAAGTSISGGDRDFALARYQVDGAPDETFAPGGKFTTDLGSLTDSGQAMALDAAGRPIVGGVSNARGVLVRYFPLPTVTTAAATMVTANAARLHGTIVNNGATGVTASFEWGLSPTQLTNSTPTVAVPAGGGPMPITADLLGLTRGTVYYFRLRADQPGQVVPQRGEALNFGTISIIPPGVISQPASGLTVDAAMLNAQVNPNGLATAVFFEWGTTTAYGNETNRVNLPTGTVPVPFSEALTGLTTDQTYHFRAVATSEAGRTNGPDRTFTPSAGAPQPQDDVVLIDGVSTIRVLDNDVDPNGDVLTLVGLDPGVAPTAGAAQTLGNLVFYTPSDGMLEDEFGYIVQDATGKQAKARVRAYRLSEIRGAYFGVLGGEAGTGQLNMDIGASGAFSLLLTWQGFDYALKGRLDSDRSFVTPLVRQGVEQNALLLLELQFDPLSGRIVAQLTDSVLGGPFVFDVPRAGDADEAVDAVAGQLYTTSIDVPEIVPALPDSGLAALNPFADKFRGSGFASVKIARNRSARFVGQMPDTEKFSAGSRASRRTFAFYSALYRIRNGALGSVSGNATLQSDFELRGDSLRWQREEDLRDTIFSDRFNTPAFLNGDRYTPPTRGQLVQIGLELLSGAFSNANLALTLGGLNPDIQQRLKFVPGSVRVVGENPNAVKLRISPTTGTFSGSFTHNVSQGPTKFSGIFITSPFQIREGRGSFRGVGAGGKVRIAKP